MSIKKTFDANGGDVSLGYSLASVCGDKDKLTVTSDSTTWLTATIADGKIKITVAKNNDGNPRNGAVTPYINGTPCNAHKINIEQNCSEPPTPPTPTTCESCEDIKPKVTKTYTASSGAQDGFIMAEFEVECEPDGGFTNDKIITSHEDGDAFVYIRQIARMSEKKYKITGTMSANPNGAERKEKFTIDVKNGDEYEVCSSSSFEFTQKGTATTCTCQEAEVRVEPTQIILGSASGSTAEATYIHNCEVTIDNTASDWVKVTEDTNKLEFKALSETTSTRNGTIYIKDANGDECETISVSQDPPPPAAHTFSFKFKYYDYEEGPMVTGDYNRYTGYDVTDFEVDGQPATMQVEVYYRRSFFSNDNEDCIPTSFQNYTGGTSANSVQSYLEGTKWCGGSLIHVNGFSVYYNGVLIKQMQGHDSELDGTYEGEFS